MVLLVVSLSAVEIFSHVKSERGTIHMLLWDPETANLIGTSSFCQMHEIRRYHFGMIQGIGLDVAYPSTCHASFPFIYGRKTKQITNMLPGTRAANLGTLLVYFWPTCSVTETVQVISSHVDLQPFLGSHQVSSSNLHISCSPQSTALPFWSAYVFTSTTLPRRWTAVFDLWEIHSRQLWPIHKQSYLLEILHDTSGTTPRTNDWEKRETGHSHFFLRAMLASSCRSIKGWGSKRGQLCW